MPTTPSPRVCFSFPFVLGRPGIGTTAMHQVLGLAECGIDVEVWCAATTVPLPVPVTETLRISGKRIPHRLLGRDRALAWHDSRVARMLGSRHQGFDVIHVWPGGCIRTLRAARAAGVTSVREAPNEHTTTTIEKATAEANAFGVELPSSHFLRPDARRMAREDAEFEAASYLLAPSQLVFESFVARGFAPEHLIRHSYGYDPARFSPGPDRNPERPFTAAFVGRLEPIKGVHHLLRAWIAAGLRGEGRLLVCGSGVENYIAALEPLFEASGAERLGFVSDVPSFLREADVLVLPSVSEGSALVTYEAMGSGCVPVVSDASGAPCTDQVDGLVHRAGDEATLAANLRELSSNPSMLAKLRQAAIRSSADLTWTRAGERLVAAYSEAITRFQRMDRE